MFSEKVSFPNERVEKKLRNRGKFQKYYSGCIPAMAQNVQRTTVVSTEALVTKFLNTCQVKRTREMVPYHLN